MSRKNKNIIKFTILIAGLLMVFGIQWKTLDKTETLNKAMKQEAARFNGVEESTQQSTQQSTQEANQIK